MLLLRDEKLIISILSLKFLKRILFILFFVTLCGELIQNYRKWYVSEPLQGGIVVIPKPQFTLDNWFSVNYQDSTMKYYEQNLDSHVFLTRLNTQIAYSTFGEISAVRVEEGKNHFLFDNGYIESYIGKDFVEENKVIEKVNKLAYVQAELKKRNVDLLFLITPGKPSHYPEYLPEKYDLNRKTRSNYDAYTEEFEKQKINFIDCRKYFLKLKPTTKHPLFTRYGVHWSIYGSTIAADTMIKYLENLRHIDMMDYYYNGGRETTIPEKTDADILYAMNLLRTYPSLPMYYPNLVLKKDSAKVKPNILFVGDSFLWSWIGMDNFIPNIVDSKSAFWYYSQVVGWPQVNRQDNYPVSKLNLKDETLHRDIIVIVYSESSLVNCGYNFIEQMYDLLKGEEAKK